MPDQHQASTLKRDTGLLWHPYGPLDAGAHFSVTGASGPYVDLIDAGGTSHRLLDGMSSWWSVVHGYRHPVMDAALTEQIGSFSHVMFGGLTHDPAVELAERLVEVTPAGLDHVFLADSGSVSVEVALKLAIQYQRARGRERGTFLALEGAYHGDTTGAMSVCDPVGGMHADFAALLAENVFLPRPPLPEAPAAEVEAWVTQAENLVDAHAEDLAGIIVEPLFQGAGGMRPYHPAALQALRRLADDIDAVLIADEIATGFGRTGTAFACEAAGIVPDVMCLGKALTGGYLTMAALLCRRPVAEVITQSSYRALMHGPTFMANPLACAAASASLGLLFGDETSGWQPAIERISPALEAGLSPARELPGVHEARVTGGIGVIELDRPVDVGLTTRIAARHGVWLRPFRQHIYTMPPYISTPETIATITLATVAAAAAHTEETES
ncbi:adenosylmethionine--8-amino-7-oxononanoate transaminase [Brevibacterium luteolum]|uniref:adenosylmethionine--8-amino-7-oxononanoate transaminase n=1 Tax=Brevibacterium luteolum TaxID=199591 RepID=UPI0021AFCDF8|nr:adenosylmethionine--8-amino-7-oxononanoate transaminase [Brevibacterium luteolum]MCT1874489.1 adenosylmethionine--8-amino-7-oxononanoate transaminase [Brevibacterium luteolum]MCT1891641.1 adenosylmethionine--8-amino-7-oxononanoate transaminase [Brevibacterium luteolum]MCT1894162.1 adenosylmethionine--8-amino-7-oxononanoate transaminase [Brevibacterium luteolum]MCT1925000.1 adenosylmethionine--8-amino-7-oxononanoate transaminase [Brevibacterium luteolum]